MSTTRIPHLVLVCVVLLASVDPCRGAPPEPIVLWPQGAPGSEDRMQEPEKVDRENGRCNVTNVHHPPLPALLWRLDAFPHLEKAA
jgi:hypothetical protein